MRSLFLKIFFSFWLTVVLMGVPFYFIGMKHRPDDSLPGMRHFGMQALARYGEEALAAWRTGGGDALLAHVEKLKQQTGIRLWLFAGRHGALSGLTPPADAMEAAARIMAGEEKKSRKLEQVRHFWVQAPTLPSGICHEIARIEKHPPPSFWWFLQKN